ncbi:MAG: hypothetical protein VYA38_02060 [Gemmatimonadota bacterium]|nr:hypothetical protein [Gemmatimonadota bacterium]
MDDGLIQFLVIAVFVILSMMDGAARKRRKQTQSPEHLPESPPETREEVTAWLAKDDDLGEAAESPGVGMELKDVLEEVRFQFLGKVPGREADPVRGPATIDADAILHEKHTEVAVPSRSVPAKRPHEFVLHSPELAARPQKELRRAQKRRDLLSGVKGGTKSSLREAIILAEVLSPPVVLRDPGWKPQF